MWGIAVEPNWLANPSTTHLGGALCTICGFLLGMGPAGAPVLGWPQGEKMCMCRKMVGLFRAAKAGKIVAPTILVL